MAHEIENERHRVTSYLDDIIAIVPPSCGVKHGKKWMMMTLKGVFRWPLEIIISFLFQFEYDAIRSEDGAKTFLPSFFL